MPRILGVDIPAEKRVEVALQYIYGIGPATAKKIGISAPTVAKSLGYMSQLDILHEVTGRERHRLFVYDKYLAILNEGTEPIR